MFFKFLATRQAYALRRAIRRNGELSMFKPQQPFANLRRVLASLLTMTIAFGPSVNPAFASSAKPVTKQTASATATPIQHLVVIFQENVSFDHYFGTYPTALNPPGEPSFTAAPATPSVNGLGTPIDGEPDGVLLTDNPNARNPANAPTAINPFRLDRSQAPTCDQDHSYGDEQKAFDQGLMDLFPGSVGAGSCGGGAFAYG